MRNNCKDQTIIIGREIFNVRNYIIKITMSKIEFLSKRCEISFYPIKIKINILRCCKTCTFLTVVL